MAKKRHVDAPAPGGKYPNTVRTEALMQFGVSGNVKQVARDLGVSPRSVRRWVVSASPEEIERYRREASDVIGELALDTSRRALEIAAKALERDAATMDAVSAAKCCRDLTQSFGKLADARQVRERVQARLDAELDQVLNMLRDGLPEADYKRAVEVIARAVKLPPENGEQPDDSDLPEPTEMH